MTFFQRSQNDLGIWKNILQCHLKASLSNIALESWAVLPADKDLGMG